MIVIKVGKRQWMKVNIDFVSIIAKTLKMSKGEVKRLFKQGAIDIYLEKFT